MTSKLYVVKQSGVHGKGVFAAIDIAKGTRIIEYKGELISDAEADRRHPWNPNEPFHTFFFSLETGECIDASYGGNAARWINHSCAPNCKAEEQDDPVTDRPRVYIYAKKNIKAGEELNYDYKLQLGEKVTKQDRLNYECRCGAKKCRGTMLDVK